MCQPQTFEDWHGNPAQSEESEQRGNKVTHENLHPTLTTRKTKEVISRSLIPTTRAKKHQHPGQRKGMISLCKTLS
jgi:hypothetical protein